MRFGDAHRVGDDDERAASVVAVRGLEHGNAVLSPPSPIGQGDLVPESVEFGAGVRSRLNADLVPVGACVGYLMGDVV